MDLDEDALPALDDTHLAYQAWRERHLSMEHQGGVAAFLVQLLQERPPAGDGEKVIRVGEDRELEVRVAWSFDTSYGEGRGLLRIRNMHSPGDLPPSS